MAPTSRKLYALSSHSGEIYGLSSSRSEQDQQPRQPERYPWWMFGLGPLVKQSPGVDYVRLEAIGGLAAGEKYVGSLLSALHDSYLSVYFTRTDRFTSLVSGKSHILALTSKGRTFSMATDLEGNSHSQLGVRQPLPSGDETAARDIRWNTALNPITALTAVNIVQLAAGLKSSYFRMADGRVLGLGANTYGQLGLGSLASVEVVPVPSEIVLARSYPAGITVKCTNISAGEGSYQEMHSLHLLTNLSFAIRQAETMRITLSKGPRPSIPVSGSSIYCQSELESQVVWATAFGAALPVTL